eukprot:1904757-Rhodomonas_salina.1
MEDSFLDILLLGGEQRCQNVATVKWGPELALRGDDGGFHSFGAPMAHGLSRVGLLGRQAPMRT